MTHKRIDFLGVPIDALTMDETISCIVEHIQNRRPAQHMAINPAKIMHMLNDPEIAKTVRSCEVITADGMGVVWASRLFKNALPCRVTGIDLMDELLSKSAEIGLKPYFLGAKQDILEKTIAHYKAKFPTLQFAGYRNGYFNETDERGIAEHIRDSECDMLFVAISSPKKEQFLGRWRSLMNVPFCMGVGGSFDVMAGKVSRAPKWMQRFGLEWLHRVQQEPGRMVGRYARDIPKFAYFVAKGRVLGSKVP